MKQYKQVLRSVDDLIPYVNNSRTHSDQQITQVASSIKEFGFTNPILIDEDNGVIAGHGRLLASKKLNLDEVPCIVLDGLSEAQRKAYVIADNQLALNSGWDIDKLQIEINDLLDNNFNLDLLGFDDSFLSTIIDDEDDAPEDNPYTDNVDGMHYEPKGDMPNINDIYQAEKQRELLDEIEKSNAPDDVKLFLRCGSYRHVKFNYQMIAEYYAHCDAEVQNLFEKSALVIIDYNDALKDGYVKLSNSISEKYEKEYPE